MRSISRLVFIQFAVLFSLLFASAVPCNANDRTIPTDVLYGVFSPSEFPKTGAIVIDKKSYSLTAGAQIRDQNNRIILPQSLSGPDVSIAYKKAYQDQIDRIWILTEEEERAKHQYFTLPWTTLSPPPVVPDRTAKPSGGTTVPLQTK